MFESPENKKEYVNLRSAEDLADRLDVELQDNGSLSSDSLESLAMKIQDLIEVQRSLSGAAEQEQVNAMIAKLKNIEIRNREGGLKQAA
ncbi:MAG TPA: hypothetical protein VFS75_03080 [Candidatus Paceibacterota bacterium]|nr:hypothetical protein [Candidatus Paceibacterota bacterium]